jgi:YHS domain-containing protein
MQQLLPIAKGNMPMQSDRSDNTAQPAKTACSGTLKSTDGFQSAMYGGERIYFCTQACLRVFEQNPDDFMAGKLEHPLEAE